MQKKNTHTIQGNSAFQHRLTAYSTLAAAGACAVAAAPNSAQAAVVYSGALNYSVPVSVSGVYVDLANFHMYASASAATTAEGATAPILNLWGTSNTYAYLYPSASTVNRFVAADGTNPSELGGGVLISSSSTYSTGRSADLTLSPGVWASGSTGYLGIKFLNGTVTDYAWVQITAMAPPTAANPIKLLGIAFDNTGAGIITGAIPEPGTLGCLAAGVVGAGSLAWRRRKAA